MINRFRSGFPFIAMFVIIALSGLGVSCGKSKPAQPAPPPRSALMAPADRQQENAESPAPQPGERLEKWSRLVKNEERFAGDEKSCRAFCEGFCPSAAKCKLGPLSQIQKCKPLCYDPCMKGVFTKNFVACAGKTSECPDLRECAKDYVVFMKEKIEPAPAEKPAAE